MKNYVVVAALISIFAILGISSIFYNSATCDEIAHHIPTGYVLLTKWDLKMDTSHPPLSRYIIALPLKVFMKLSMPDDSSVWRVDNRAVFGRQFMYKYNKDDAQRILLFSRLAIFVLGILCAVLLFVWARRAYGPNAAVLSLFLYSLSPIVIANSSLATTDMAAAFFIFLSAYSFWEFIKRPSFSSVLLSGLCLGLAQLSKYTALLLYPLLFLTILFYGKKYFGRFAMILLLSLMITWAGYGFDLQPILKDAIRIDEKIAMINNIAGKILPGIPETGIAAIDKFFFNVPVPLGAHILGIVGTLRHGYEGHATYFMGSWSGRGHPLYFLTAIAVKTPVAMLIFFIAGIFISIRNRMRKTDIYLIGIISSFLLVASLGRLQIGIRHILPVYPFIFMLAGKSAIFIKDRYLKWALALLAAWYAMAAIMAWPHYIGYFNELAGGSKNGYKILRDSNVDWGQDLPALAHYISKNGIGQITLLYFGEADPGSYGVAYRNFSDEDMARPGKRVYAVSANYLDGVKWLNEYKPVAMAGYSIFVYDLRDKGLPRPK